MAVQELVRVVVSGTFDAGDVWQNVWYADWDQTNAPASESDASDIADQFEAAYVTFAANLWTDKLSLDSISVQDLNFEGLIPWEFDFANTGTASDTMPQILACVATLRNSGMGGASQRGRIFLPMMRESALGPQGLISVGVREAINGAVAQLSLDLAANTASRGIVIFSRKLQTWVQVTQVSCNNLVEVQRGRQNSVLTKTSVSTVVFGT